MGKAPLLTESYRHAIRNAMGSSTSLANITRETGVIRVVEFMLEDRHPFAAAEFYQYLEERGLAESTNIGIWSSVSTFFKTMNGWDGEHLKNPFYISPYCRQRKYDAKYIPKSVAQQLDAIFKKDEVELHIRCAYWLLRLIPSRIGEIVGMP